MAVIFIAERHGAKNNACDRTVFGAAIIPVQHLYIVFLNLPGLFGNMLVGVGNYITAKLPISQKVTVWIPSLSPAI